MVDNLNSKGPFLATFKSGIFVIKSGICQGYVRDLYVWVWVATLKKRNQSNKEKVGVGEEVNTLIKRQ